MIYVLEPSMMYHMTSHVLKPVTAGYVFVMCWLYHPLCYDQPVTGINCQFLTDVRVFRNYDFVADHGSLDQRWLVRSKFKSLAVPSMDRLKKTKLINGLLAMLGGCWPSVKPLEILIDGTH